MWWHGAASEPPPPPPPTPPLDLPGFPVAVRAYSVRKVREAYAGNAMRVRRSSDNTETDIGFVDGYLDETALTTFVGGGDGFVTIWYDQSTAGVNAVQATTANQPQIVASGSILRRGTQNRASVILDGTNDNFSFAGVRNYDFVLASVAYAVDLARFRDLFGNNHGDGWHFGLNASENMYQRVDLEGDKITSVQTVSTGALHALYGAIHTFDVAVACDGNIERVAMIPSAAGGLGTTFVGGFSPRYWQDGISEWILYQETTGLTNPQIGTLQTNQASFFFNVVTGDSIATDLGDTVTEDTSDILVIG